MRRTFGYFSDITQRNLTKALELGIKAEKAGFDAAPIADSREMESHGKLVSEEGLMTVWFISNSIEDHIKNIEYHIKLGFNNIHLQNSSWANADFITTFGSKVLPYLRDNYGKE